MIEEWPAEKAGWSVEGIRPSWSSSSVIMSKYVYIMGRGRSGSTVLDCLLDNAEGVQGMGETVVGLDANLNSLGAGRREEKVSSFWGRVRKRFCDKNTSRTWAETVKIYKSQAHPSNFIYTIASSKNDEFIRRTVRSVKEIYETVQEVSGAEALVDSSKEVTRGLLLAKYVEDCHIIHLVRDPRSVLSSNLRKMDDEGEFRFLRRNWNPEGKESLFVILTCINWLVGNILCEIVKKYTNKILKVRLEDLKCNPEKELCKISESTGLKMEKVIQKVENRKPMSTGVGLRGNRMRRESEEFVFESCTSEPDLPVYYENICNIITYPLKSKYGY